jgi:hypothetical protein
VSSALAWISIWPNGEPTSPPSDARQRQWRVWQVGQFLALYWCQGTPVDPLVRWSFDLHVDLSERIGIDWSSRRVETLGIAARPRRNLSRLQSAPAPGWLGADAASTVDISAFHLGRLPLLDAGSIVT